MARMQTLLETSGLKRGDKVAMCSKNCSNWAISFLSIAANQGVIVSIMDAFVGSDIEKLVNHSDAKAIFAGPIVWKKINMDNMPNVKIAIGTNDFELLYAQSDAERQWFINYIEKNQADMARKTSIIRPTTWRS